MDLTVKKASAWVPVAVDDDGTPLLHGERAIQTGPGEWMEPTLVTILDYLAKAQKDTVPVWIRIGSQDEAYVGSVSRGLGMTGVPEFLRALAAELDGMITSHAGGNDGAVEGHDR